MGKTNIVYGLLMGTLAVVFLTTAQSFPVSSGGIDSRVFPSVITILALGLSVLLFAQGLVALISGRGEKAGAKTDTGAAVRIAVLAAAGFAYTQLMDGLGYVVATPFLIALVMVFFEERRWYRIVLVSVATTLLTYFLFRGVFRVPLPTSIFL